MTSCFTCCCFGLNRDRPLTPQERSRIIHAIEQNDVQATETWIRDTTHRRKRRPSSEEDQQLLMQQCFWTAVNHGSVDSLKLLVTQSSYSSFVRNEQKPPSNSARIAPLVVSWEQSNGGETLLFRACARGDARMVRYLCSFVPKHFLSKWFARARTTDQYTIAHILIQGGHLEIVTELLRGKHGASFRPIIRYQSSTGATPLLLALLNGDDAMVRLLVEEGQAPLVIPTSFFSSTTNNSHDPHFQGGRQAIWMHASRMGVSQHLVAYLYRCQWWRVSMLVQYLVHIHWFCSSASSSTAVVATETNVYE